MADALIASHFFDAQRSTVRHTIFFVDRVDYRRDIVWLRDDRTGRYIEADMRDDRYGRLSIDDLRPGDYIELSGGWVRGDIFVADRIESVRDGRGRY